MIAWLLIGALVVGLGLLFWLCPAYTPEDKEPGRNGPEPVDRRPEPTPAPPLPPSSDATPGG